MLFLLIYYFLLIYLCGWFSTIRLLIKLQVKSVGFCISGSTSRANGNVTVVCKAMHSSAFLGWLSTSHQQQQNQYKMISEKH
jgi:hypothetical protein